MKTLGSQFLGIVGTSVALYLVVSYATGSGALVEKSTAGAANVIRSLQGR
jgi:hypothetical protein